MLPVFDFGQCDFYGIVRAPRPAAGNAFCRIDVVHERDVEVIVIHFDPRHTRVFDPLSVCSPLEMCRVVLWHYFA
ncbi:MAG: hypothetical protein QGG53_18730, partial [Planctomycetota bacterium]|nr:hypothetical protein [Planctomycetota bacterium]